MPAVSIPSEIFIMLALVPIIHRILAKDNNYAGRKPDHNQWLINSNKNDKLMIEMYWQLKSYNENYLALAFVTWLTG